MTEKVHNIYYSNKACSAYKKFGQVLLREYGSSVIPFNPARDVHDEANAGLLYCNEKRLDFIKNWKPL